MLNLIQNEWMKLWAKKGTWIMVVMLIAIVVVPSAITKYYEEDGTWQEQEQENVKFYEGIIAESATTGEDISWAEEQIAMSNYRLEHQIAPNHSNTFEATVSYGIKLVIIVTLFSVIIAASIVSSEFSTGTIKMLLTRPVSRAKVITSKLITVFLFGLLFYGINLATAALTGFLLFGEGSGIELTYVNGAIVEESFWGNLAYLFVLSLGDFVMSILFAFLIGSVFRSSSLAIGLTLFISFTAGLIVMFLSKYEIVNYIWLTHSNLTQFATGNYFVEGMTLPFSLTVLAIYAFIFLLITYVSFMRRDITA